jgi:hypothetical protein
MATQPTPNTPHDANRRRGEGRVGVYDQHDDIRTTDDPLVRDQHNMGGASYTEPADAYVNEPRRDLTDPAMTTDPTRSTAPAAARHCSPG